MPKQQLPGLTPDSLGNKDYGDHTPAPSTVNLAQVEEKIEEAQKIDEEIGKLTKELARKKKQYDELTQLTLPELLAAVGLTEGKTNSGYYFSIETKLHAGLPSATKINKERDPLVKAELMERRDKGFKWLKSHGHGNLIKHLFKVEFPAGDAKDATKFRANLKRYKNEPHHSEGVEVNTNTLTSVVRALHEQGDVFPKDILGVFERRTVKIKA